MRLNHAGCLETFNLYCNNTSWPFIVLFLIQIIKDSTQTEECSLEEGKAHAANICTKYNEDTVITIIPGRQPIPQRCSSTGIALVSLVVQEVLALPFFLDDLQGRFYPVRKGKCTLLHDKSIYVAFNQIETPWRLRSHLKGWIFIIIAQHSSSGTK